MGKSGSSGYLLKPTGEFYPSHSRSWMVFDNSRDPSEGDLCFIRRLDETGHDSSCFLSLALDDQRKLFVNLKTGITFNRRTESCRSEVFLIKDIVRVDW